MHETLKCPDFDPYLTAMYRCKSRHTLSASSQSMVLSALYKQLCGSRKRKRGKASERVLDPSRRPYDWTKRR
jgi:hypothetical protein